MKQSVNRSIQKIIPRLYNKENNALLSSLKIFFYSLSSSPVWSETHNSGVYLQAAQHRALWCSGPHCPISHPWCVCVLVWKWRLSLKSCFGVCAGFSGFPHQWFGDPRLRLLGQQTEHLSGCGERGVWTSCGSTLWSLFLLQPLHDMCRLPGGGAGPAGEM